MDVTVLRLGHRPERDKRITTHVALTARALGARRVLMDSDDQRIARTVEDVGERWGGDFEVVCGVNWRRALKEFDGTKVHLTMYGLPHTDVVPMVDRDRPLMVVVGAEKVPRDVYDLVDHNVAVGNQPHSEVAAVAILLYDLVGSEPLTRRLPGGRQVIHPSATGKDVESLE